MSVSSTQSGGSIANLLFRATPAAECGDGQSTDIKSTRSSLLVVRSLRPASSQGDHKDLRHRTEPPRPEERVEDSGGRPCLYVFGERKEVGGSAGELVVER